MNAKAEQLYENPEEVRSSEFYQEQYEKSFAEKWDELINWEARAKSEGRFFIDLLKERGKHKILDVATGTGFHSISLLEEGFNVTSVDGSPEMLAQAFRNGRKRGHILSTVQADWRWLNKDIDGKFDAVICLGNSFTHLFSERARRKALAEFYAALRHDGILILDQRNYDRILDEGFTTKHRYYYCGEGVTAEPESISEDLTRFKYTFPDGSKHYLNMFPLRKEYTCRLMTEVGFQYIESYGDFKDEHPKGDDPDFYIHVAEKSFHPED